MDETLPAYDFSQAAPSEANEALRAQAGITGSIAPSQRHRAVPPEPEQHL